MPASAGTTSVIHRIGTRLAASFAVLVLIIAGLSIFGIKTLSSAQDQQVKSQKLANGAIAALHLGDNKRQQRVYQAEYAVDRDPNDLKEYNEEQEASVKWKAQLLSLVSDDEIHKQVQEIDAIDAEQQALWTKEIVPQIDRGDSAGAQPKLVHAEELVEEQIDIGNEINDSLQEQVAAQEKKVNDDADRLKTLFWVAGAVSVLIAIVLAVLVTRSIVRPVRRLKVVSDRIAEGQLEGLKVDTSGRDEIAELAQSMNNVAVAFEVMYSAMGAEPSSSSEES